MIEKQNIDQQIYNKTTFKKEGIADSPKKREISTGSIC